MLQSRAKTALGFLAAATLLSGSAFAFSPEWNQPLPTVLITDKFEAPTTGSAVFDPAPATTSEYLFRYTNAFDPFDYITLNGNAANSVRFLFNEFDDENDGTPNTQHTLSINDTTAVNAVPLPGDFASAPFLNASPTGDSEFDFRNIDFSPGTFGDSTSGSAVGSVTGDNIDNGPQSRIVSLYIKSDDAPDVDNASMLVVTLKDTDPNGGDSLSDPFFSDPFSTFFSPPDMSGWSFAAIGALQAIPGNGRISSQPPTGSGSIAGFTRTPSSSPSAGGTTSLTITSTAAQYGLALWTIPPASGPAVTAHNLYRMRMEVSSSNAATAETVRLRMGNLATGIGESSQGYIPVNPTSEPTFGPTPQVFNSYILPKDDGNLNINFDLLDQSNPPSIVSSGTGSDEIALHSIEVAVADRSNLGGSSVVANVGGTGFSVASGQPISPAGSPTAFGAANFSNTLHLNQARAMTFSNTASARSATFTGIAASADFFMDFTQTGALNFFTGHEGRLYAVDVWVSTDNAAGPQKPYLRIQTGTGQQNAEAQFPLDPTVGGNPNPAAVGASAKVYSLFVEPQLDDDAGTDTSASFSVFLQFLETLAQVTQTTTLTIHQVTVTEYDLP